MRLVALLPAAVAVVALSACGSEATPSASASASAAPAPKPTPTPAPSPAPTPSATASAGEPKLPGTALKDVLKDVKSIMIQSPTTGAMGAMVSDKKDVAAIIAAIGTDQTLSKKFEGKCTTTPNLDFVGGDKSLGKLGFCDPDATFKTGRFDGSGAEMAALTIKDPAAFKAALKKAGAVK